MGGEGADGVDDEADRRLVAGGDDDLQRVDDLLVGEGVAVGRRLQQAAGQVVARLVAFRLDERLEDVVQFGHHRRHLLARDDRREEDVEEFLEPRDVVRGHSEQLGDDRHRHRVGVVGLEVDHAVLVGGLLHGVEHPRAERLDARAELLHPAHGERLGDEVPQPPVLGAVGGEHGAARVGEAHQRPVGGDLAVVPGVPVVDVLDQPAVGEQLAGLGVVGDGVDGDVPDQHDLGQRPRRPQPGALPVEVADERVERDVRLGVDGAVGVGRAARRRCGGRLGGGRLGQGHAVPPGAGVGRRRGGWGLEKAGPRGVVRPGARPVSRRAPG